MALEVIILLSVIQGFTEFLPISSSAHLVFLSDLFGGFYFKKKFRCCPPFWVFVSCNNLFKNRNIKNYFRYNILQQTR